ncbi:MAG: LamG-like jellyroll fold domain-containing protein, partial [Quisquiliibacterium sp.]
MLPLAAYVERLSARPGQTLRFHVANATGKPVQASIVRVLCADPNPEIGGVRTEAVQIPVTVLREPGPEPVPLGSFAALGNEQMLAGVTSCSFSMLFKPTLALSRRQVLVSTLDAGAGGFEIELSSSMRLRAHVATSDGIAQVESHEPMRLGEWRKLFLVVDDAQSVIRLLVLQPDGGGPSGDASARLSGQVLPMTGSRRLSLASARADQPLDSFNGLLEGPSLLGRALSDHEARAGGNFLDDRDCLGNWDFSREMQSRRALDLGPAGRHGELFNSPARGMRGASWDGQE